MSERPLEYLKRTCLICGCHTNQTINIYEPRSGPNIVQLIQAKFKFQPLNEDKYLCFSCNNWLINWHSLQAVNSNDAENGSHMNSMTQQKGADGQYKASCRPIAQVKPTIRIIETKNITISNNCTEKFEKKEKPLEGFKKTILSRIYAKRKVIKKPKKFNLYKRSKSLRIFRNLQKYRRIKYFSCRQLKKRPKSCNSKIKKIDTSIATSTSKNTVLEQSNHLKHLYSTAKQKEYLKSPIVDGKIVSMLRRLGTSLTRETTHTMLPPIMSPTKIKPLWTRPLEKDEILISFDSALSETDINLLNVKTEDKLKQTFKRKLSYQNADVVTLEHNHSTIRDTDTCFDHYCLPKELVVSLV